MKRRSFFRSLAKAAAIVALAPQLAFRARPERWLSNSGWETVAYEFVTIEFTPDGQNVHKIHEWKGPPSYVAGKRFDAEGREVV